MSRENVPSPLRSSRLAVQQLEDRTTPTFLGGVFATSGDITGDGVDDLITAAGAGGGPHVQVFDGETGVVIQNFYAYDPSFTGGVSVAVGDVTGDGYADLVTAAGAGGGPHVKVFDGAALAAGVDPTTAVRANFYAYAPEFAGGVSVAVGDIDADGYAEVITGAGAGGGPHVQVFDGAALTAGVDPTAAVRASFYAFAPEFAGGVNVASADVDGDEAADIVTGAGAGGGPHVRVLRGLDGEELHSFFAFDPTQTGGVWVAAGDTDADGSADLIAGTGAGTAPRVAVYDGAFLDLLGVFAPYVDEFRGGVRVGVMDLDGDEAADVLTAAGAGGGPHVRGLAGSDGRVGADLFAFAGDVGGRLAMPGRLPDTLDADQDGVNDAREVAFGADPTAYDTDGDLLPDGYEVRNGLNPRTRDDISADPDGDGLTHLAEVVRGTSGVSADTDGDGVSDGGEAATGGNPRAKADGGQPGEGDAVVELTVGDHSGSESERYNLKVGDVLFQSPGFGEVGTDRFTFRRGQRYEISVTHQGTDPAYTGTPRPDYDYTAGVYGVSGDIRVDDPQRILDVRDDSDFFYAAGKAATLYVGPGDVTGRVTKVEFTNPAAKILKDGGGDYSAPHWQENQSDPLPIPVVFKGGDKPRLKATFTLDDPDRFAGSRIQVRARGTAALDFPSTEATLNGGELTVEVETRHALGRWIDKLDASIEWEALVISPDGTRSDWSPLGSSRHTVYVALQQPADGLYETMYDIAARSARRVNDPTSAVAKVFDEFRSVFNGVERRDGAPMSYWNGGRATDEQQRVAGMLRTLNGSCVAWSQLFHGSLLAAGVSGSEVQVVSPNLSVHPAADGILVENWVFNGAGITHPFPYVLSLSATTAADTAYGTAGVAGQLNSNPPERFGSHYVVRYGERIYDPSYGKDFSTQPEFEAASIAGVFYFPGTYVHRGTLAGDTVNLITSLLPWVDGERAAAENPSVADVVIASPRRSVSTPESFRR